MIGRAYMAFGHIKSILHFGKILLMTLIQRDEFRYISELGKSLLLLVNSYASFFIYNSNYATEQFHLDAVACKNLIFVTCFSSVFVFLRVHFLRWLCFDFDYYYSSSFITLMFFSLSISLEIN